MYTFVVPQPGDGLTRMLRTLQQNGLFYVEKLDDVQFEGEIWTDVCEYCAYILCVMQTSN